MAKPEQFHAKCNYFRKCTSIMFKNVNLGKRSQCLCIVRYRNVRPVFMGEYRTHLPWTVSETSYYMLM